MGGERLPETASFTYISYCDMITTQILNWSESSEYTKMRLCCGMNRAKKPWVYVRSGLQPCPDSMGWIFGWVRNQTKPFFRSKPGPLAGYPDLLLTLDALQILYSKLAQIPLSVIWRSENSPKFEVVIFYTSVQQQWCAPHCLPTPMRRCRSMDGFIDG